MIPLVYLNPHQYPRQCDTDPQCRLGFNSIETTPARKIGGS